MNASPTNNVSLAFSPHNHSHCVQDALKVAVSLCEERAVRLTPLRKQVLELIWQSHKPLGAYTLIDMLAKQSTRQIAPPTVYRTLDFLLEQHLIHRLDTLNAYIGCPDPTHSHPKAFLLCAICGHAEELHSEPVTEAIQQAAANAGFSVQKQSLEVLGLCCQCRTDSQVSHD